MRAIHYFHQVNDPPQVTEPVLTDEESVRAALERLGAWMPIGRPCLGTVTEHAVYVLMAYATEHLTEEEQ